MNISPEMVAAKEAIAGVLMNVPGVAGVDIGLREIDDQLTSDLVIRVIVQDLSNVSVIQALISETQFPIAIIQRDLTPLVDSRVFNPLIGGISISAAHGAALIQEGFGTLGGFVIDNDFGDLCGISAGHVIASSSVASVVSGDPIFQPEGGAAGSRQIGSFMRASIDLDAAIFALDPTQSAKAAIVEIGDVGGKASVDIQESVRKRGRTTGLTSGTIQNAFPQMFGPFKGLSIEIWGAPPTPLLFCAPGDSGSLIVNKNNQVAGLLVAGGRVPTTGVSQPGFISGWAISIDSICSSLRVTI